jgi:tol-pal system protein YbgF
VSFTRSALLPLVALSAFAAAPATAALFGDDVARKGVAEQQRRVDALNKQHEDLASRLARLEDAMKGGNQPVLELATQLQAMREELRTMRGQLEVVSNSIEAASKRQRDMYVDLDTRIRRFEQAPTPGAGAPAGSAPGPSAAAPPPPSSAAAAAAGAAGVPPAVDETRTYEAAQNHRRMGNYQAAVVAFQNFVTHYPRSPLAHRAQYWVGDSYFNLRDYRNAIANQQKLIATYPESASVPDALLNIASSYLEMGDNASARKTMDTLVARYPSSDAAEKARRRLASLR